MDTDAAFIVFIICFAYSGYDKLQAEVIIFSASACVLSFTNLILARSDGKINAKSLIFIVSSIVIMALLAFALGPFAGAAGEALFSFANAVKKLLLTLLHYLELFIRWFASLFPNNSIEGDYYSEEIDLNLLTSEGEDMIDFGIMPFIIMALAIIALALVFLIYLKKHKIKIAIKGTSISQNEVPRKRVPFISALTKALNKLRRIIKSELFLLKNRNSPIGQYYLLVRKLKTSQSHKRLNETPREFLTRIEKEELITPVESFLFERTAH